MDDVEGAVGLEVAADDLDGGQVTGMHFGSQGERLVVQAGDDGEALEEEGVDAASGVEQVGFAVAGQEAFSEVEDMAAGAAGAGFDEEEDTAGTACCGEGGRSRGGDSGCSGGGTKPGGGQLGVKGFVSAGYGAEVEEISDAAASDEAEAGARLAGHVQEVAAGGRECGGVGCGNDLAGDIDNESGVANAGDDARDGGGHGFADNEGKGFTDRG